MSMAAILNTELNQSYHDTLTLLLRLHMLARLHPLRRQRAFIKQMDLVGHNHFPVVLGYECRQWMMVAFRGLEEWSLKRT